MKITPEVLLEHGYRKYRHHDPCCEYCLYQRMVSTPEGVNLYAITFYFSDLNRQFPHVPTNLVVIVNSRMYRPRGDLMMGGGGFDLNMVLEPTATLDVVEAFYAQAFSSLGCGPDWYNQ